MLFLLYTFCLLPNYFFYNINMVMAYDQVFIIATKQTKPTVVSAPTWNNMWNIQGRESKGRLITPYRSAAFVRGVINHIPKSPVSCHWSSHKEKNLRTFLHLLLLYTSCNSTNTFVFSSLHFTG